MKPDSGNSPEVWKIFPVGKENGEIKYNRCTVPLQALFTVVSIGNGSNEKRRVKYLILTG